MNLCQARKVTSPIQTRTMASQGQDRALSVCSWPHLHGAGPASLASPDCPCLFTASLPLLRPTTLAGLATCRNISGPILLGLNETPRFPAVWCLSPCWGLNWDLNLCLFSKGLKFYAVFPGRLNTSCKIWSPNAEEVLFLDTVKTDPFFFRDRAVDPEHVKSLMWSNKPHPRLCVC